MVTSKSPRKVLKLAHTLACAALPDYFSRFSRHAFTKPQLFACLVLREHQKKSFRGIEALLIDSPSWLAEIGMRSVPDHNTLCRAFRQLIRPGVADTMMDLMAQLARRRKLLTPNACKPVSIDSSLFESRHVSRHFETRRRQSEAGPAAKKTAKRPPKPATGDADA